MAHTRQGVFHMKPYEYDLNLLYVFHEIVRTGSLSAAGRKLRISRSGVSQKLKALESSIGTQLIRRSTRDIDLTGSGQCLYDHCVGIFEQLDTAERQLSGLKNEMQGIYDCACPPAWARTTSTPS